MGCYQGNYQKPDKVNLAEKENNKSFMKKLDKLLQDCILNPIDWGINFKEEYPMIYFLTVLTLLVLFIVFMAVVR